MPAFLARAMTFAMRAFCATRRSWRNAWSPTNEPREARGILSTSGEGHAGAEELARARHALRAAGGGGCLRAGHRQELDPRHREAVVHRQHAREDRGARRR